MSHIPHIPPRDAVPDGASQPPPRADPSRRDGDVERGRVWRTQAEQRHVAERHAPAPLAASGEASREPAFLLPGAVIAMLVTIGGIQLVRSAMSVELDRWVQIWFAFIPARYIDTFGYLPGGLPADAWTFVTYALLHGSWVHLLTNCVWLVAFGSAVARRFGPLRFWLFSATAAAGGAALHLAVHFGDAIPVVGASAAIAGLMAAAARFVFDSGGPLVLRRAGDEAAFRRPARSLVQTLRNRSALVFIVLWFAINFIIGIGSSMSGGLSIAWEAHVGGFLVGLLLFRWVDPVPR